MDSVLTEILGLTITPWKLIGYLGVGLFTGRWFVQMYATRRNGRPTVPRLFWYMSISGSLMCLAYFVFGKPDSVGVLANAFPVVVAAYNLWMSREHSQSADASAHSAVSGS